MALPTQVTLEEQMICGALQTLNEEALEDVLQNEPAPSGEPHRTAPLPAPPTPPPKDRVVLDLPDDIFL